jgi:hypothetical protein
MMKASKIFMYSWFLLFTLIMSILPCASLATPAPDVMANSSNGPVTLDTSNALSVTVSLSAGSGVGMDADWWVAADTPFGWHYYLYPHGWYYAGDLAMLPPAYQGALFDLSPVEVINITGLPAGTYVFYFGVDTVMNGELNFDHLYYDGVLVTITSPSSTERLYTSDFTYLGAFRLPGDGERPYTFAYGGNAMTFRPDGDPSGSADGFPGSLFVTGHDRLASGILPNGSQIAEISIPVPVVSKNLAELNQAMFIQGFHDAAQGLFPSLDEIPRIGMEYLYTPATGAKIHLTWGQHLQDEVPSHAWIDPNLAAPNPQGTWYIGNQYIESVNGYLFEVPASWADMFAGGRYLATGRYRDGGWSGQGPALFAYRPWIDEIGTPAPSGTRLSETVLLLYESSLNTDDVVSQSLNNYQHTDEWEGGAWITTTTGKSAVMFAGTKGTGAKYWYGWINPAGAALPCVETDFIGEFTVCRLANGSPCPPEDLTGCVGHSEYRGWWGSRFDAQIILYDPADLAQVATGAAESWAPQPYATLDIDDRLLLNPPVVEAEMLGTGDQRRIRIGAVAYDRASDLIYVLELFADEARPVVHVWRAR